MAQPDTTQISYPQAASKKGLQVQMLDDALELGIHHAALNLNLGQLIQPDASAGSIAWRGSNDFVYHFDTGYVQAMDQRIKRLSDNGVIVSLIILNYEPHDEQRRRILIHPSYSPDCPNHLSAFNCSTVEGRAWLQAALEFMSQRWSESSGRYGQVWNWIIGNEVNSHWFWCNMGPATMQEFADDYYKALTLACRSIHRFNAAARVFVSLDHHWNIAHTTDQRQSFDARSFLEYLSALSSAGAVVPVHAGNKSESDLAQDGIETNQWHVAFHPYPENLFEPRTWRDATATADWRTAPRITFRNIEQLEHFLDQPTMLIGNSPRRVILSEQGFHTPDAPDGQEIQAAAFCYAWLQIQALDTIDAFILHRHVDHAHEGGLRLGLWTRQPDSVATPDRRKKLWSVFQAAGTPHQSEAFGFAEAIYKEHK
ncbi:MAG: hypothetical protein KF752_13685 [Pirellulaceae bacterium]|nr:hypothetical protein [Pirellulaceae bacterium]